MANRPTTIPSRLQSLMAMGRWPAIKDFTSVSPIAPERVRLFAGNENAICLFTSFHCLADETQAEASVFWEKFGALGEISQEHSIVIGDFGLGSDAPIILDCREGCENPPVLYLRYFTDKGSRMTTWTKGADTFDEFVEMLGLDEGHDQSELTE